MTSLIPRINARLESLKLPHQYSPSKGNWIHQDKVFTLEQITEIIKNTKPPIKKWDRRYWKSTDTPDKQPTRDHKQRNVDFSITTPTYNNHAHTPIGGEFERMVERLS